MPRGLAVAVAALVLSAQAAAADLALLIANARYPGLATAREAPGVLAVEADLVRAGFRADVAADVSAAAMRAALAGVSDRLRAGRDERVVLVFAGYAVHGPSGAWLLGTDSRSPDLATLDATGVRLDTLLAIAGQVQGGALVALVDLGFPQRPAPGLTAGLPPALTVPQGVTVARGRAAPVAAFLRAAAQPGTNLARAAAAQRGVTLEGFVPPFLAFVPDPAAPNRTPTGTPPAASDPDATAWAEADRIGTIEAYRTYLDQFPQGRFAVPARAALDRLENTPDRIEARLNLTRDERRAVQRHLALLGFDPRGIDGLFGPMTRGAITGWQRREGLAATGFLDRDQVQLLAQQAARRAAALEEEARQRQDERERQDRAFWRDSGAGTDEAGMRAYLQRFPDGIFAQLARDRLAEVEAARRAEAQAARDRADWDRAVAADTEAAYRAYLAAHPQGAFAAQARARLVALAPPPDPAIDAAAAAEAALNLPPVTRLLVEQRLAMLGFDPGPVDGAFDLDARDAIFEFQRASGLPPTGYLTQQTLMRLIGGGLLRLLE